MDFISTVDVDCVDAFDARGEDLAQDLPGQHVRPFSAIAPLYSISISSMRPSLTRDMNRASLSVSIV